METGKIINKISHNLRRRSQAVQETIGISESQGRILDYIIVEGEKRNVYQKDIEANFDLRPPTATGILRSLETQGLIARIPDERDGRMKKLVFTEKADSIKHALKSEIEETERLLLKGLSEKEREAFMNIAGKMLENLNTK